MGASLASRKMQDLILQDFSRKTLGARLARQKFTKNSIFLAKNGVFSQNCSNESSKKTFLIIFFLLGRLLIREIHCFHTSSILYSEINYLFWLKT